MCLPDCHCATRVTRFDSSCTVGSLCLSTRGVLVLWLQARVESEAARADTADAIVVSISAELATAHSQIEVSLGAYFPLPPRTLSLSYLLSCNPAAGKVTSGASIKF